MPTLSFPGVKSKGRDPQTLSSGRPRNSHRAFKASARTVGFREVPVHATRRTGASLLVALDVHPRVAVQILRHSQIAVTMNVYAEVASASSR